jgi:hypothetical protein
MAAVTDWWRKVEAEHAMSIYDVLSVAVEQSKYTRQSIPDLAAEWGCSPSTIHYRLKKIGLKWPKHNARPTQRIAVIAKNIERAKHSATINGETRSVADWCRILSVVTYDTARQRIRNGWSPEKAVTKPLETPDERRALAWHAQQFSRRMESA